MQYFNQQLYTYILHKKEIQNIGVTQEDSNNQFLLTKPEDIQIITSDTGLLRDLGKGSAYPRRSKSWGCMLPADNSF